MNDWVFLYLTVWEPYTKKQLDMRHPVLGILKHIGAVHFTDINQVPT